jgi:16S rRNA (adenine1518-N6/adenine1519-N6)-dimethyltransferase
MSANKSLGQHWLNDHKSLQAMSRSAGVKQGDTVLEIGPGQGSLTRVLLEKGAKVVAVELDESLAAGLEKKFAGLPFILNKLSILDFDLSTLPNGYKIVANIPYYLTAHLLRMLSETQHKPSVAVLLVQKEVAQRVSAKPGELSALALLVQFYYEVKADMVVPAGLFKPPPKVDSQILILKSKDTSKLKNIDTKQLFRLINAGFGERRKKLRSSLAGGLHISKQEAEDLLKNAGIDPNMRAQELTFEQWYKLYKRYNT